MNLTQICPGCQVRLVVRDRVRTEFITCPRCLTAVHNPHRVAAAAPSATPSRPAGPVGPTCTVCAEVLPDHANSCPASPAQRQAPPWAAPAADREASSDASGTYAISQVLSGLVLLGVFSTFGPIAAFVVGIFLGFAILVGGRGGALRTVLMTIVGLFVTFLIICGLALAALFVMCAGMKTP